MTGTWVPRDSWNGFFVVRLKVCLSGEALELEGPASFSFKRGCRCYGCQPEIDVKARGVVIANPCFQSNQDDRPACWFAAKRLPYIGIN